MMISIPPSEPDMNDWANDLSQDYHVAAVRLATITEDGNQHLLLASVELALTS
jgi:hypothetical protein